MIQNIVIEQITFAAMILKILIIDTIISINSVDVTAVFSARAGIQKLGRRLTILPIEIKVKIVVKSLIHILNLAVSQTFYEG